MLGDRKSKLSRDEGRGGEDMSQVGGAWMAEA